MRLFCHIQILIFFLIPGELSHSDQRNTLSRETQSQSQSSLLVVMNFSLSPTIQTSKPISSWLIGKALLQLIKSVSYLQLYQALGLIAFAGKV